MLRTRICPRKQVTVESSEWLQMHRHYRAGFLLCAGGVIDQPASYLEAMSLIDAWMNADGR